MMNDFDIDGYEQFVIDSLQCRQSEILEMIYENHRSNFDLDLLATLNDEYTKTVNELKAILTDVAPCCEIDQDLWTTFLNVWKSEHGFKPLNVSYADAKEYVEQHGQKS